MSRIRSFETTIPSLLQHFKRIGDDAPPLEEKVKLARSIREHASREGFELDEFFIKEIETLAAGLSEAGADLEEVRALVDKLCRPPLHFAVFLESVDGPSETPEAVISEGGSRRLVTLGENVDPETLACGDEVMISSEHNFIVGRSQYPITPGGETAQYDRSTSDGRLVLRCRDEEVVVTPADALNTDNLDSGDLVRWERQIPMAFEKVERSRGSHMMLEDTPEQSFAQVGGCDAQISALKRFIELHLHHREVAQRYGLRRKGGVLLVGPPGTGKTMLVRSLANWLAQVSPSGRSRFMNIKPSGLLSMWYGQTEANYREAFRVARQAGEEQPDVPVVMFFDEIDSIGAARSNSLSRVHDSVLPSLMAELDGLESRGNVLVVAATNRVDALDPALLRPGRLGDQILEIPRPNKRAAQDILGKYLRHDLPYAPDETCGGEELVREALISSVLSRIYSPNGSGDLAKLTFRDGTSRSIGASDLISGASIAKIVDCAIEQACVREIETGHVGVRLEDLLDAAQQEFEQAVRVLTPLNCHQHLTGLPQDVDVVSVDPLNLQVPNPHRYLQRTA
ncbi:MAG: AAA family ATPase [bacterium]|nr:AAA family ATPase [bacterium]